MRIFLVGYMGCGKSTLARKVAHRLELRFIDMDQYIEEREGMTIAQIFEAIGQEGFRQKERESLSELLEQESVIVATGGGAPCFFDNMERINQRALAIYIDPGADALVARLMGARAKRPLIKDMSDDQLREFVTRSLAEREPFYKMARLHISGRNISPADVVNVINYHQQEQRSRKE